MDQTRVIVVRHGQTIWNTEGRFQGHLDSELTPDGMRQARGLARRLQSRRFDALYSSDLGRAVETARIISESTGHGVISDPRLRERNLGVFQGLRSEEIEAAYPEAYARHRSHDPDYVVSGGESLRQQVERNIACFEELAHKHTGHSIVIVTHGGVLSGLFRHVLCIPLSAPRRFDFPNSGLNVFTYRNSLWTLSTWGDVNHLEEDER